MITRQTFMIRKESEQVVSDEDLTGNIRTVEVNSHVSDVSKIREVRKIMVDKQREMGSKGGGVVMEGRDITTIVFPSADVKIFLTALLDERASRRAKEFAEKGTEVKLNDIRLISITYDNFRIVTETFWFRSFQRQYHIVKVFSQIRID